MYFEILVNSNGRYHWVLKALNHEIVATSETYSSKQACMKTIDSIKSHGIDKNTKVKDLTTA